jgi:hypothetical protein
MLVEKTEPKIRYLNKAGKHQFKIIEIGDRLTKNRNTYLRVTCITRDDRLFIFPIYTHDKGMKLINSIASCIGDECIQKVDGQKIVDTAKFVGGFITATVAEYTGNNELYESGYYIIEGSVRTSPRRYDITGSRRFKRVKQSNRVGSTYEG